MTQADHECEVNITDTTLIRTHHVLQRKSSVGGRNLFDIMGV